MMKFSELNDKSEMATKLVTSNIEKQKIVQFRETYSPSQIRVLFLKTHKTGSSTVSSILWRQLCKELKRNCFLPPSSNPGRTWDFARADHKQYAQSSLGTQGRKFPFEVWLSHAKYHEFLTELIPAPRIFLSIVRRPALRFQSAWHWYKLEENSQISLSDFLGRAVATETNFVVDLDKKWKFRTGLDSSSQELVGMSRYSRNFAAMFRRLIADIAELKLFVLVNERFEESLVVLRWLLRWETKESLWFLPRKVQNYERITNETQLRLLDELQPFDSLLYRAANHALDEYLDIIRQYEVGKNISEEIDVLRRQLNQLPRMCNESESLSLRDSLFRTALNRDSAGKTKPQGSLRTVCAMLAMDNDDFVQTYWKQEAIDND